MINVIHHKLVSYTDVFYIPLLIEGASWKMISARE